MLVVIYLVHIILYLPRKPTYSTYVWGKTGGIFNTYFLTIYHCISLIMYPPLLHVFARLNLITNLKLSSISSTSGTSTWNASLCQAISADRSDMFEGCILTMTGMATYECGDDGPNEGGPGFKCMLHTELGCWVMAAIQMVTWSCTTPTDTKISRSTFWLCIKGVLNGHTIETILTLPDIGFLCQWWMTITFIHCCMTTYIVCISCTATFIITKNAKSIYGSI